MISDLKKTFPNKVCKIADHKKVCFYANFAMIRRLYKRDQEVRQQRSGGYTIRIRKLYNKDQEVIQQDQEVMFSKAIIEPLQKTLL